jgi:hypothetical protein
MMPLGKHLSGYYRWAANDSKIPYSVLRFKLFAAAAAAALQSTHHIGRPFLSIDIPQVKPLAVQM